MKKRYLSLSLRLNILMVVIIVSVFTLLLFINDNTYWKTAYDPYLRRLSEIKLPESILSDRLENLMQHAGREDLHEARNEGDLAFIGRLTEIPVSEDDGTEGRSVAVELADISVQLMLLAENTELDEICVEAQTGQTVYRILRDIRGQDASEHISQSFGAEGPRFPGLLPEDYSSPTQIDDGGAPKIVRCIRYETDHGTGCVWLVYDMGDFYSQHSTFLRRSILFVLVMAVLSFAAGVFLLRKFVVRRIQNLAKAAGDFDPGEDGLYTMESVCRVETEAQDEIGDLGREICSMQERIVGNTESMARMTAEKERISTELNMSADIQAAVLPKVFPAFPDRTDFDLYASMTPARMVGGDFYDFFLVDEDHLALVIADVSEKSVPAALFMMVAKALIKTQLMAGCDPALAMERANRQLCEGNTSMMFVTVWLAVVELSTGRGSACNAGHERPALRRSGGTFELEEYKHDRLAGAFPDAEYHSHDFQLHPSDCVFVYTDGVTEASDPDGNMFRKEGLIRTLNEDPDASPQELIQRVQEAMGRFVSDAPQYDDITMLCMKYYGPGKRQTGLNSAAEDIGKKDPAI